MLLEIVTYPDSRLRKKSAPVENFDTNLHEILDNMYETMIEKGGVGLAAIQVGIAKRMLVINLPRDDKEFYKEDLLEIINPEILEASGEILFQEGCLSVPNFFEMVQRFSNVVLKYCDRFGEEWILEAEDYLAVAIQHEIDHLNGVLFVDKLSILKRKKFEKEFKRLKKEGFQSVHLPEMSEDFRESYELRLSHKPPKIYKAKDFDAKRQKIRAPKKGESNGDSHESHRTKKSDSKGKS